jgi:hypothetical protein
VLVLVGLEQRSPRWATGKRRRTTARARVAPIPEILRTPRAGA